jgi:hypothetical protein
MSAEHHSQTVRTGHPVLDIGDDVGGVIFFTPQALCWQEIEIAPIDGPDQKTHTEATERLATGTVISRSLSATTGWRLQHLSSGLQSG